MKRIKTGITLITMFGLLLGTASVASAKTTSPAQHKMQRIEPRLRFMLSDRPVLQP